jgi:hypothetical protein
MAETQDVILRQPDDESLRVQHRGTLGVHGDARADPLQHRVGAELATAPDRPLVHMVLWDEDCACEVNGRLTLAGDEAAPVHAALHHRFDSEHRQSHRIETALAAPVHHALQMRTPLQVRFCNSWQIASDYSIEIRLGGNRVIGVHLTGATIAKPLPCDDAPPCEPAVVTHPLHP